MVKEQDHVRLFIIGPVEDNVTPVGEVTQALVRRNIVVDGEVFVRTAQELVHHIEQEGLTSGEKLIVIARHLSENDIMPVDIAIRGLRSRHASLDAPGKLIVVQATNSNARLTSADWTVANNIDQLANLVADIPTLPIHNPTN